MMVFLKSAAPQRAARALLAAALIAAPAQALGGDRASLLIETGTVYAPRGFSELCDRRPEMCVSERMASDLDPMQAAMARLYGAGALTVSLPQLTPELRRTMERVNTAVNATIRPVADVGPDHWALNSSVGDCEEYVLMKREMLARLGFPRAALRITVVQDAQGYHAVLVVATAQGEFVLDNMVGHITTVADSPYEFVVAQSLEAPGSWVRVHKR